MSIKIGILGSRDLACNITNWMIEAQASHDAEIIGVVAPPFTGWWNDNLSNLAKEKGLPLLEIEELVDKKPDILFSINYWKKIEKEVINKIPKGIVNIHHSYLLKYKGRYSTSWAIANARKLNCWEHGSTLHYIDEHLDEGNIIASEKCEITETDTAEILFKRVEELAVEMFKNNFGRMLSGVTSFLAPCEETFFYDKDSNKNLELEYGAELADIYDFVRAWSFKDRPLPYFTYKGQKIFLKLEDTEAS